MQGLGGRGLREPARGADSRSRPGPSWTRWVASRSWRTLSLPGHREVLVAGDMFALDALAAVAQVAIQGGRYVAGQLKAALAGSPDGGPLSFHDKGAMATILRSRAVASIGGLRLGGLPAEADVAGRPPRLPRRVQEPAHHIAALDRQSFAAGGRSKPAITGQQTFARQGSTSSRPSSARPCPGAGAGAGPTAVSRAPPDLAGVRHRGAVAAAIVAAAILAAAIVAVGIVA